MDSWYEIAFDGKGSWSLNDDFAWNFLAFEVDNSSSLLTDNIKNDFLILGNTDTFGINGSFFAPEKTLILVLVKQTQNIARVCLIIVIMVTYLQMENKSTNLKLVIKITFRLNFG